MSDAALAAARARQRSRSLAAARRWCAHGLVGRADRPIPEWLFGWAAAVVLIISFLALSVLWPEPKLEYGRRLARRRLDFASAVNPVTDVLAGRSASAFSC